MRPAAVAATPNHDHALLAAVRSVHRRAAPWPYQQLDVPADWHPTPVRDIVLKVHQRCNLACDYCYVYTQADQSWRDKPAAMSTEVRQAAIASLGRYARRHQLNRVRVVVHGGEPLLYGVARLAALAAEVRAELPAGCATEIGITTNGVRLDAAMLDPLRAHRIMVGVSVDGTAADHDRHRRTHTGRGSFAAVSRALDLLRRPGNRDSYAGILCTVSPDTDPLATYEQLLAFEPPVLDLLLPHANWQHQPWRPDGTRTPYAGWLIPVFDRWYDRSDPIRIRLFEDILVLLLGGASSSEQVGLSPSGTIVVESDGAIEQVDALKSAYPGACATGLDIRRDELDTALLDPGIVARQIGRDALAPECLACPIHQVCGGGHYAHRYRPDTGFRNPSVYCDDMQVLVNHIKERVAADVRQLVRTGA